MQVKEKSYRTIALIHGAYFVVTGIWPLVSMRSFMWVTGYKVDQWLVDQVGLLALSVGAALLLSAWRNRFDASLVLVVVLSTLSFLLIDTVYSLKGRISPVYLADAAAELVFLCFHLRRLFILKNDTGEEGSHTDK